MHLASSDFQQRCSPLTAMLSRCRLLLPPVALPILEANTPSTRGEVGIQRRARFMELALVRCPRACAECSIPSLYLGDRLERAHYLKLHLSTWAGQGLAFLHPSLWWLYFSYHTCLFRQRTSTSCKCSGTSWPPLAKWRDSGTGNRNCPQPAWLLPPQPTVVMAGNLASWYRVGLGSTGGIREDKEKSNGDMDECGWAGGGHCRAK